MVEVSKGVYFQLPRWTSAARSPRDLTQMLEITHKSEIHTVQARLSVEPDGLRMVALDPFGSRLFSLYWNDAGHHLEATDRLPVGMEPGYILADILAAFWPMETVRAAFVGTDLVWQDTRQGRRLFQGQHVLLSITWQRRDDTGQVLDFTLENFVRDYQLLVQSQEVSP
jgi:hypothetical protein